ncbi:MAG: 3-keto-5-aminohexanoate cleavage enzyme [Candidatus Celerinatantimonas neptuna]|nr:MAG: 3-keto-5-aminohexanoate cleavage enzyme [Candidatus Celerinatantimonas neptuna]
MNTGNDVIISAALTGAMTPKDINENIPLTPKEIAADAYRCWQQGAAIVHLHMRDEQGIGTMDQSRFKQTIQLIRSHQDCDVIINCTTSGDSRATDAQRMAHIAALDGIEMASWDAGSFNWMPGGVFVNSPQFLGQLAQLMSERSIKPELEIFDSGMLGIANYFVEQGLLATPLHCQFCLGVPGGMPATVENLLYLVTHRPAGSTWSAFGIGKHHLPILYAALALGGHIRVGLEDNVYFSKGIAASNVQLVERAAKIIRLMGKPVATPARAREILGLVPLESHVTPTHSAV